MGGLVLGVIGGTGLYQLDQLSRIEEVQIDTPFGQPSAPIVTGWLGNKKIAFIPRHGKQHEFLPSEINFRANIFALKTIGVRALIGVSAVGSLKQEVRPADLALPNQYLDLTRGIRAQTFFGQGLAAHVSTADPVCSRLSEHILQAAKTNGQQIHTDLVYACVEGPRLGTRAESHNMRSMGCGLVGMTNVPEAFLAREAQLPYATICIVTDFDCWLEDQSQHAQVDQIMDLYRRNLDRVKSLVVEVAGRDFEDIENWPSRHSLKYALMSKREAMTAKHKEIFSVLEA
jgi:5'-methylthioadenosine phosphorylase